MDPSGRPWRPENTVKYKVFAAFHVAPQKPARTPKSAPGRCQNDPQEAPRSSPGRPRRPQERPKTAQDDPKSRQESPRSAPGASQIRLPGGLGGQMGSTWPPKSPPEASRSRFWTFQGTIFDLPGDAFHVIFNPRRTCSKLPCVQSLCKHTASIARRACVTPTCVCNFYMWISTATDRESIDR